VLPVIDNPETIARLVVQMEDQLPIPAFPTKDVVRTLRRRGVHASTDRALSVNRVFYAGDEAGIVCDVTPSRAATEVLIVSLTHLRIAPKHPLFPAILAYQRERVRRLAAVDA
jgi:hypothetical protein